MQQVSEEIVTQIEEGLAALEKAVMLVEQIPGDAAYYEAKAALEVMGQAMRYAQGVNDELRRERNALLTEVEELEYDLEVAKDDAEFAQDMALEYVDELTAQNIMDALVAMSGLRYDTPGLDDLAETLAAGGTQVTPEQVEILRAVIFHQETE